MWWCSCEDSNLALFQNYSIFWQALEDLSKGTSQASESHLKMQLLFRSKWSTWRQFSRCIFGSLCFSGSNGPEFSYRKWKKSIYCNTWKHLLPSCMASLRSFNTGQRNCAGLLRYYQHELCSPHKIKWSEDESDAADPVHEGSHQVCTETFFVIETNFDDLIADFHLLTAKKKTISLKKY